MGGLIWAAGWAIACGWNFVNFSRLYDPPSPIAHDQVDDQAFIQAQNEYLAGRWAEAESLVAAVLNASPNDHEARLLLATILRRTRRFDDARRQLNQLEKSDHSGQWIHEIEQERQFISDLVELDREDPPNAPVSAVENRNSESTAAQPTGSNKQAA